MKKLITFLTIALLTFAVPAFAWQVFTPPLVVEEVDGAPTLGTTTTLVFPNGTLTVVGGTATYTPVAGAGIGGIDTYVQYNDGGVFGGDAGFVYDDATDTLTNDKVIVTTSLNPAVGNTVDLGTALLQFQDGFFSGTVTAPIFAAGIAGTGSGSYSAHHGGQFTFFDDGNDTSVVLGPVTDGTTILGVTGSFSFNPSIYLTEGTGTHILKSVNEAGLDSRLTIGVDETARAVVFADYGDIDTDFGLSATGSVTLYIMEAGGIARSYFDWSTVNLAGGNYSIGASSSADIAITSYQAITWQSIVDLTAGHLFTFETGAGDELTDADARQAFLYLEPKINQTGTAALDALYLNATLTSLGDGTTGDGNNLLNLAVSGTSMFRVDTDGIVTGSLKKQEAVSADPEAVNVAAIKHYGGILNNDTQATGDTTFALDVLVSGMAFSVYIGTDDDDDVYLDPNGAEIIILNGTPLTGGFRVLYDGDQTGVGDELACKVVTIGGDLQLDCKTAMGTWISAGS